MKTDNLAYVDGLKQMVREGINQGYVPYLATFTFYEIGGSEQHVAKIMKNEIERLYHLVTQRLIVRNAKSPSHAWKSGLLIAAPDWPVRKLDRQTTRLFKPNSGMHFHGMWLTPPVWLQRTNIPLDDYLRENQARFVRRPMSEAHIKPIVEDPEYVLGYILKALLRNRIITDDLLILPRATTETKSVLKRGNSSNFSTEDQKLPRP